MQLSVKKFNGKKKTWCWDRYLEEQKAIAAPVKLFTEHQTFPSNNNGFKVGMRLEGIDPLHPSMLCVLSVAEVLGYRIRLHFDGFSHCYDFWVNADSPDIHPVGWCKMTGHKLQPPKAYKEDGFDWESYLTACNVQAAPKNLFKNQNTTPSGFQVGMKLEAVDRKNPSLVCVASIADVVGNRFLVHFDNWDDTYDYWCNASSPHIHPVGWCQDNGRPLTAPQGYPNPENFSWEKYLEETGTSAVTVTSFKVRPAPGFLVNMKLEAVDKRNPMLLRVATVVDAEDYRIKRPAHGFLVNMKLEAVDKRNPMLLRVATVVDAEDYRIKTKPDRVNKIVLEHTLLQKLYNFKPKNDGTSKTAEKSN
ncbi:UNVERIFIED_CONTAM: hypothetical protein FKN15_051060 [Acipenser sinensis]